MKKKIVILIKIFILLGIIVGVLSIFFNIKISGCDRKENVGIIDGHISKDNYTNVIFNKLCLVESETHGDKLLDYILNRKFQQKIYYYDATDEQEQITSDTIISGLDWMVENNISNINISLSTKYYDTDISTWIKIHPEIHVYCSYNNKDNSYDYPAMYEGVIGSGASKNIKYKAIDKQYYSNQMLIVNNGLHYYYGNSFLSLETMLTNEY